jgi:uncharacterized protein
VTGGGSVLIDSQSVIVKTQVALAQLAADKAAAEAADKEKTGVTTGGGGTGGDKTDTTESVKILRRYVASLSLDPDRTPRDVGRVAEEVLMHLSTLPRAKLRVTVHIDAEVPEGVPEDVQRIVLENGTALKFDMQSFERS